MNYEKIYIDIIENANIRTSITEYIEKHHIIPRSLGGNNDSSNIVKLTAKEHFICHLLLLKICKLPKSMYKMYKAFYFMSTIKSSNQLRYRPSRYYSRAKKMFSKAQSFLLQGDKNPNFGKIWINKIGTCINKTINKNSEVPIGYQTGRVLSNVYRDKVTYRKENKIEKHKVLVDNIKKLYILYIESDYSSVTKFAVESSHWTKSPQSLLTNFRKYIPNYNKY